MSNPIPSACKVPLFVGNKQIKFGEKAVPTPGPGQLLLRVHANALCGSERPQFFDGRLADGSPTATPGHEAAGTVVAAGSGTRTAVGTSGVVFLMDFCGECRSCRLGFTNQCLQKRGDMGFNRDGGYGQYELVHESIFFPVPDEFSATEATLLLDIMGTGGHAIERCQMVRPDIESLIVLGAGPIGLGVLAMAKIILGRQVKVFVTDIIPYRLKMVEQLGGVPINVKETPLASGLKAQGTEHPDMAVDTTGKQAAREDGLRALGQRGSLICVGHGEGIALKISPDIIAPERSVVGSEYFRFDELPANLRRLTQHRAYLNQIITHRMGVDEIQHAFEIFFQGETGKVIIEQ
ncbi:MAG: alcohol dehydrogenase catalytic domain-containing protein [Methylacidiphilales bacterium]|nr:alcohol dehydrogenase catalytic domain-containing protein [Candidatus Methylacidiphilales bacterium]